MNQEQNSHTSINPFIALVRLGIGHWAEIPSDVDWKAVRSLAAKQGLAAIVLDGVKVLMDKSASSLAGLDFELKMDWTGESIVLYEQRYEKYLKTISELAGFYNSHGFRMMVLKGYGLSLNYPVPSHRPCGDIDIFQFGQSKEADQALNREKGVKIDNSHHHHTVFRYRGFLVENHYDFVNVYYGHGNKELEKILKSLAEDDSKFVLEGGQKVYLPSPNLHALFQIRHCMLHFASSEINLRQLLDWAFFAEKHSSSIDWKWLVDVLRCFKMMDFFNYLNAICVEDLGFDAGIFGCGVPAVNQNIKERILKDIITPEFSEECKGNVINRVAFKYRRWQANAWKQRLCYSDNRFVAFWKSAWAHLLKPSSI